MVLCKNCHDDIHRTKSLSGPIGEEEYTEEYDD